MSVVTRLSCSRVLFARACQPARAKAVAVKASAPAVRNVASQAFLRCTMGAKKSLWAPASRQMNLFQSFHCSAMAEFSADTEPEAEATVAEPAAPAPPAPNTKLYVGNISWNVDEQLLRETFESFGTVETCEVVMDVNGRSRGFAFVTMGSIEDATTASENLNSQMLDGREMRINFHQPRDPNAPRPMRPPRTNRFESAHRLYVGNLPWSFDDFDLQDTFEEFGTIVDARVITDRETGRSRGFGFVTMATEEEIERAISELDGSVCEGRSIRVNKAER